MLHQTGLTEENLETMPELREDVEALKTFYPDVVGHGDVGNADIQRLIDAHKERIARAQKEIEVKRMRQKEIEQELVGISGSPTGTQTSQQSGTTTVNMPAIPEGASVINAPSVIVYTGTTTVNSGTVGSRGNASGSSPAAVPGAAAATQSQLANELFKTLVGIDIDKNIFGAKDDDKGLQDLLAKEKSLRNDILSTEGGAERLRLIEAAFQADQKLSEAYFRDQAGSTEETKAAHDTAIKAQKEAMARAGITESFGTAERKNELIAQRNALQQEITQLEQSPAGMNGFNPMTFMAYDRLRGQIMEKFTQWHISANSNGDKFIEKTRAAILEDQINA